jgi:hypothetical protein
MGGILYARKVLIERYLDLAKKKIGEQADRIDDLYIEHKAIVYLSGGAAILVIGDLG